MSTDIKFWNKIAEKYAKSPIADMDAYNYTLERTRSYLKETDAVLELGAGTGSTSLLLAESVNSIVATDLAPNMTRISTEKAAKAGVDNVTFIASDILGEEIPEGPYDAVMAFNLLHLVEELPQALERVGRMVKPGGFFISKTICQLDKRTPWKFRIMKTVLPVMQWIGKAPFVKFWEIAALEAMITAQGFQIIETGNYPASPPNRYIVARKVG